MIRFGTAGVPSTVKSRKTEDGVREIARLGLDCMEVEFVQGVRMGEQTAVRVGAARRETGVVLTAHGPYYVNLCSLEDDKRKASEERIFETARRAHWFGGSSITFHAAFNQGRGPEEVRACVRESLTRVLARLKAEGIKVRVSPELTGKPSQFGSLEELIKLSREVKGLGLCIDFSHLVARESGGGNDYEGFSAALTKVKKGLGARALKNLHMHVSGIEWTAKGEKRHQELSQSSFAWKDLLRALADHRVSGNLICESPVLEQDALKLKREYGKLMK